MVATGDRHTLDARLRLHAEAALSGGIKGQARARNRDGSAGLLGLIMGERMDMKRLQGQSEQKGSREVHVPTRAVPTPAYQLILYNRALHPELFQLKGRRVLKRGEYELEAWLMNGMHVLRFGHGGCCVCELLTEQERSPASGVVAAFVCSGEREFEHTFDRERVTFMSTIQTETLTESIFDATYMEFCDLARQAGAMVTRWEDEGGKNLSVIDVQEYAEEVHVQAYHMQAGTRLVVRTQTIFEHA